MTSRKRVVQRIQDEVFGGGDLALVDELYAAPLAAGVKQAATALRAAFPDLALEIEHLIEEDDQVACRWTARGTHRGVFHNLPATGKRATWSGLSFYAFDASERVVAMTSNWDVFGLLQQLRRPGSPERR